MIPARLDTAALVTIPGLRRQLTPTERRVVLLSYECLGYAAIAERLHCRPRTIKAHMEHVADKLADAGLVPGELHPSQRVRLFALAFLKRS